MYPNLFGISDFSYLFLIIVGVATSIIWLIVFLKHKKYDGNVIKDVIACTLFTVALGVVGAILFQNFYNFIKNPAEFEFSLAMTFYGGLIVGVVVFILIFDFYVKKHNDIRIREIAIIAPLCITSAHAFGRIGCLLAGCCYGKPTNSWIGMDFPGIGTRIPTQLIEAIFLFILTGVLCCIIFKTNFKWTLHLYLAAYSIFRFIIEFFRGDAQRGGTFLGMYPSQIICVLIWIIFVPTLLILKKFVFYPLPENDKK